MPAIKDVTVAKSNFEKFVDTDTLGPNQLTKIEYATNADLLKREQTTGKLLALAMEHLNKFDSLETASKILGQAIDITPSDIVIDCIKKARKNILAAHKSQRPRFKMHYTKAQKATIKKNSLDTALEFIAEALVNLRIEEDKRTGNLFENLTSRAAVTLPTRVKNPTSKFMVREAPVVVSVTRGEPKALRNNRLETKLYLIYAASFIGVCTGNLKKRVDGTPLEFAMRKSMEKFGCSVHVEPVHRPSDGLSWFLVLNFDCSITYAAFPDYVRASYASTTQGDNAYSYEEYVRGVLAKEAIESTMKADRLRVIRESFEENNKELYELIATNKKYIEFKQDIVNDLKTKYVRLTSLEDGESDGLKTNQYGKFDDRFSKIAFDNYIDSPLKALQLRKDLTAQRLKAREIHYTIRGIQEEILALTKSNKAIIEQLNGLKRIEATKHGIVGRIPVEELEAA